MAYLAPIHRPSSIRHAIKLDLTAEDAQNLVVAKANRLEIYSPHPQNPDQLVLLHTKSLYGRVTLLHKLHSATGDTDHLFVGTDRYYYFTLSWDPDSKQFRTEKSYHDIADKTARDSQSGDRVHVDPSTRFLTLECFEGVVNVMPISHASKGKRRATDQDIGELGDPIQVRISEFHAKDSCFVHKRQNGGKMPSPEMALLHEDLHNDRMRITIRVLEFEPSLRPHEESPRVELSDSKEVRGDIDIGASHLIPLPAPMFGLLVLGETRIAYIDEWEYQVRDTIPLENATVFVAWCAVDEQRYVLADDYGILYLLFIHQQSNGEYSSHTLDVLGETSRASTLVYLDGGRIFVGSHQGDSQVIQISEKSIEVVQSFSNVAPILDFTVMDMGNRSSDAQVNEFSSGQARIVSGSGAYKDGSLRSVRSGVGLEGLGSIGEMGAPVAAMFTLKSHPSLELADTLVVSFVSQTRIFRFAFDGEVEELDSFGGFQLNESTLFAGDVPNGRTIQVLASAVHLTDTEGRIVIDTWQPPSGTSISAVAAESGKVLVSLGGAALQVLDVSGGKIQIQAQRQFDDSSQVSCIALASAVANACVAGFWQDSKVAFLDLETLQQLAIETVAEDDSLAVPRSLAIANILRGKPATLFVGLADGHVVTYSLESPQNLFANRKSIVLGTQQADFALLPRGDGMQNVFATCEHASLIYGSEDRMVYSAVTVEDATSICGFDSAAYPGAIVIATGNDELKLALVDEERTTHVQTLKIGETVRRIAYSADLKAFGLGTIKRIVQAGSEEVVSHFKLVDEIAFQELDTFQLNRDELIESVIRCKLDDGSGSEAERFVIGTAFLEDQVDGDASKGRICVFEVTEGRHLKLLAELNLRGACRCLGIVEGHIVAALIKTVVVYAFEYENSSRPLLVKKASYRTSTAPIDITVTENIIAVTDLMKSVSLVRFTKGNSRSQDVLEEVARHFETVWGTAIANVDSDTYLESDAEGNLIVLQHDVNGFSEEDQRRLRVTSEMLLGEMVNRIRRIDVQASAGAIVKPRAFLGTVEGSLYLFALISPGKQDLLMQLQSRLAGLVQSPGNVPFSKWRGFRSTVRDMGEEGPSRFVDGELIERFTELTVEQQTQAVAGLDADVEEIKAMVENLRRIH